MLRLKLFLSLLVILLVIGVISIPLFIKETVAFTIPRVNKTITIEPTDSATLKEDAVAQMNQLSSRAQVLGENSEKIVTTAIQADTATNSTLANRAIEYGRYLYCKQVVDAHETTNN